MTLKGNWILGSWVLERQNWEGALRLHHSLVSHEDRQAGGPQYRWAIGRLDTEQAWGSPPRMILSFLPKPNYILETSVLVTTERGSIGISGVRLGMLLNILQCADSPNNRELSGPKCWCCQGGEGEGNTGVGGTASAMVKVMVRSRNQGAKWSLLLVTMETPAQISTEQHFSFGNLG